MLIKRRNFLKGLVAIIAGATAAEKVLELKDAKSLEQNDIALEPTTYPPYVGLTHDGKEINDAGYERVSHNEWDIADSTACNNKEIKFPKAKSDWKDITGFIITDRRKDGNVLAVGNFLNHHAAIHKGDSVSIAAGNIFIELS